MPEFKKFILKERINLRSFCYVKNARFEREYKESMAAQNTLFDLNSFKFQTVKDIKQKSRARYNAWENFYTVYMYDFTAYHTFCTDLRLIKEKFPNDFLTFGIFNTSGKCNLLLCFYAIFAYSFERKDEPIFRHLFYVLDENGNRKHLGDEKHIYRVSSLHFQVSQSCRDVKVLKVTNKKGESKYSKIYDKPGIYEQIYNALNKYAFDCVERIERDGLYIYPNDQQAEIAGTWNLPLKDRVLLHLRLLRCLRKGFSVQESLERMNYEKNRNFRKAF